MTSFKVTSKNCSVCNKDGNVGNVQSAIPGFTLTGRWSSSFPRNGDPKPSISSSGWIVDAMEEQDAVLPPVQNLNLPSNEFPSSDDGAVLFAELDSLRISHRELESRLAAAEESLATLQTCNLELSRALQGASAERDSLRLKLIEAEVSAREDEEANWMVRLELSHEVEIFKSRFNELVEERTKREITMTEILDSIRSARDCFSRIGGGISDDNLEKIFDEGKKSNFDYTLGLLSTESRSICELGAALESKFMEHDAIRRKEKKELENSIVSLTEENRDMSTLLRVALVEKEAVERNLNKLKGGGEQKRGAILQIAERGLQRVGFGFVMGVIGSELQQPDQPSGSAVSDGDECKEEVISVASTVEKMMKNLRLEISELRQALEESRLENEHLQSLIDEQAHKIAEGEQHIRGLEERENILTKKVEKLMEEIKEAGEEAARWREACELEVEAGKAVILEREKEVSLLRDDLKRTKSSLDAANNKLHLKEKLAKTAMAAQAAAEATLQLADRRSAGFRERIEELTRQLEEEAERGRRERGGGVRRRVRYICWPWQAFRISTSSSRSRERRRRRMTLPELESLLRFTL